ncbi:hypothetical protein GOBAR_AA06276 [Gossypium barbadense]|uniref:Uncharacterized protein n=1 Tax=Gossypium barbadense TaxID=3634 RepID=A0A2P5YFE8_GOSBA|nr:hypothetical protein GOBAR_AA06276 [Gossypium barbadense]
MWPFPPLKSIITHHSSLINQSGQAPDTHSGSCSFSLEGSYQLKYKSTISGIISNNRLKNLSGISVKILFLWLNIVEVVRDEDELEFSVGIASASFPIDNFYECPQCGCGLDCANSNGKYPYVSDISRKMKSWNEVKRAEWRTIAEIAIANVVGTEGTDHMIVKALPVIDDGLCSYKATLGFRIVDVEVQFCRCPRNHVQAISACISSMAHFTRPKACRNLTSGEQKSNKR